MARGNKRQHEEAPGLPAKRSKGFKVGPGKAQGRYTGHADKIKATLIHKATVKRAYAKTLQREGMADAPRVTLPQEDDDAHPSFAPPPASTEPAEPITETGRRKPSRKGKERAVELPRFVDPKRPQPVRPERPPQPQRKTPEEIEALKQRRQDESKAWRRKRPDGRVDQASRMSVLLGKIERTMGDKR